MFSEPTKREWRRKATKVFRETLSTAGALLPVKTKVALARRSSKLGYLLARDGEFVFTDYLGCYRVNIDTKYSPDRAMLSNTYESDLWWTISEYVKPGDICLDIGANVGAVALNLAKSVGPAGKVLCFEPGPVFFQRLKANVELNPSLQSTVELYPLGLAEKPGSLYWEEDPEFPGNAYLFGNRGSKVEVTTLDDLLGEKLKRIDFIKIDVEGMEFEVLSGAKALLSKFKPRIFFETSMDFEAFRKAPIRKSAADLLLGLGYRLFRVTSAGSLESVAYPNFSHNTLALP